MAAVYRAQRISGEAVYGDGISGNNTIAVPVASLSLSAFAPTVSISGNNLISVPAGGLSLTGFAPTVTYGASPVVTLRAGSWIRYIQIV